MRSLSSAQLPAGVLFIPVPPTQSKHGMLRAHNSKKVLWQGWLLALRLQQPASHTHTTTPWVSTYRDLQPNSEKHSSFWNFYRFIFDLQLFVSISTKPDPWSLQNAFSVNAKGRSVQFNSGICFPRPFSCLEVWGITNPNKDQRKSCSNF